jgi:macrodomain Ter protein organizer (MatP/YcbG family)
LASQTISWLTTASMPVKQTIRTKNQIGKASQLWTRNHSLDLDFSVIWPSDGLLQWVVERVPNQRGLY